MAQRQYRQTHITDNDWTPEDASGAGLAFTVNEALYQVVGRLCYISLDIFMPATGNGSDFSVSGLKELAAPRFGFSESSALFVGGDAGSSLVGYFVDGVNLSIFTTGGVAKTNADLSGKQLVLSGAVFKKSS